MDTMIDQYACPLFLVGVPRSGTKLLRSMLMNHPQIRFSSIETEFFPYWVAHWDQFATIDRKDEFERFYRRCMRLPFFIQNAERGLAIDCGEWFRTCDAYTPAAVFEALMRCVLSVDPKDHSMIWGDKSPSYIVHVPLLLRHFPTAKIIHIVRDVRDCSLSIHKAWGKNMLRAAQRWQDDVAKCREDGRQVLSAYMEIRFEDLLAEPRAALERICAFVGVNLDEKMLTPGAAIENLGDAKGISTLLTSNVGKYQSRMSPGIVTKIEMIACATLRELNYPCTYTGEPVRLSKWRMRVLQIVDGLNLLRASIVERGFIGSVRFHFEYFRTSGNRVR